MRFANIVGKCCERVRHHVASQRDAEHYLDRGYAAIHGDCRFNRAGSAVDGQLSRQPRGGVALDGAVFGGESPPEGAGAAGYGWIEYGRA